MTPEDRVFTKVALEEARRVKGSDLTTQDRRDVLEQANNQLKSRNASSVCRAESAQAGEGNADFTWQPHRPFRR